MNKNDKTKNDKNDKTVVNVSCTRFALTIK